MCLGISAFDGIRSAERPEQFHAQIRSIKDRLNMMQQWLNSTQFNNDGQIWSSETGPHKFGIAA